MSKIDFQQLNEHFYITTQPSENPLLSFGASELLDPPNMELLINTYAPLIKGQDTTPAGTYFASWLGGLALAHQYTISVWNCSLDMTLENWIVELYMEGDYGKFAFVCRDTEPLGAPEDDELRNHWREQRYRGFYLETLKPLMEAISAASGNTPGILWGQLPSRFNYYLELFINALEEPVGKQQLEEDYHFLSRALDGESFGLNKNPFDVKIRWVEDLRDPGKKVRMKNQCCLYYKTDGGTYCYTCPRLKESERAERRKQA
ncbi:(2Fe-2S)-binding protein [Brevibacillus reuszeri]|uniref:(2Fe-2S)-binding protein n=1 Tax=Brevibacillus reuszeri TaxID=54915 RepID=UPI003D21B46B